MEGKLVDDLISARAQDFASADTDIYTCLFLSRYEALDKAKTQHKDKTSTQLGKLAKTVIDEYAEDESDTSLEKMHQVLDKDGANLHSIIKSMYMFGETSADIFQRRIQGDWKEAYP